VLADAYIHELGENEHAGRDPDCRWTDPARYERENSTPPAATFAQRPCLSYQVVSAQRLRLNRPFDKAQERADVSGMTDTARLDPFAAFVREYQDMVYATAVRLLSNPAEAEDVAQTVFLKAFERFEEIGSSPAVAGWLKTVTTNLCLNYLSRYRSRWRLFSELQSADGAEESPRDQVDVLLARSSGGASPATQVTAEGTLHAADEQERLEQALRHLPDHQRVPIVLFHFEDKSYVEIAAMLGVSLAKVKTDIHRGREALRAVLAPPHAS
jgi:RNA polymerase sigma-70 factor, ECF subfamily